MRQAQYVHFNLFKRRNVDENEINFITTVKWAQSYICTYTNKPTACVNLKTKKKQRRKSVACARITMKINYLMWWWWRLRWLWRRTWCMSRTTAGRRAAMLWLMRWCWGMRMATRPRTRSGRCTAGPRSIRFRILEKTQTRSKSRSEVANYDSELCIHMHAN